MKLIIAGGRDIWVRYDEMFSIIDKLGILYDIQEIVSGCASGIDSCGIEFADEYGIRIKRFPADWTKYGDFAGPRRNREMAVYADALLLIWDGKSKGSKNMLSRMKGMGKPVYEIFKEANE